jgi:hypothetical protein
MCYGTYPFKRVSKEYIKKVLDKEEDLDTIDANIVEIVLFNYYNRLSPAARSSFLGLMNKAEVRDVIIRTLSWYFGKIPESIRNEVLLRIAAHDIDYISEILQENSYAVYTYITKAMLEIADFIQKSIDPGAPSAGILLDRFNEELNKPEPEKSKLKSIWSEIEKVLPSITTMAEAVSKIAIVFN